MPKLPLGFASQKRRTTWSPQIRAVNVLAEKNETNPFGGIDHIQRPGLSAFSTLGSAPVRGVFRQAGTFNGDFIVSAGLVLYRVTSLGVATSLGAITGTDRTNAAATATRAIVVANGIAYSTNGTTITPVVMPDGRLVSSVAQLNGYFLFTDATTGSARVYYTEPGQTDPDGLGFFSTESVPGTNVKIERVGDELWLFKQEGIEVHVPTGDADLPFQRLPGRNYDKGCRAKDTIVRFDNSVAWVGNDGLVYRGEGTPVRISDNSVEEQIRKATVGSLRAWSFAQDGHTIYALTMDGITFAYDVSSGVWSEFKSYGRDQWRVHVGDAGDTFTVGGDDTTGVLYRLDSEASNDVGEPLERIVTGGYPVVGDSQRCDTLDLYISTGTAEDPNLYPKARIRWSDDGEIYGDFEDVSIGRQGNYGAPVRMWRLGAMTYPGRLFEITVTDDVVATIHGAAINEPSR